MTDGLRDRERYARQLHLRQVGARGQAAFQAGRVRVLRADLSGWVCARYLVGAGVGHLVVPEALEPACRAVREDVRLERGEASAEGLVEVEGQVLEPGLSDPLADGAEAARWALVRLL